MDPIARQACVQIRQEIGWTEKRIVEEWYDVVLYQDRIQYKEKEVLLKHVFDLSYRGSENNLGFLYLHTTNGVHSLYVKTAPSQLIDSFRKLKRMDK